MGRKATKKTVYLYKNETNFGFSGNTVITFVILAAAGGAAAMYFLPSISMNAYNQLNNSLKGFPDSFNKLVRGSKAPTPTPTPAPKKKLYPPKTPRISTTAQKRAAYTYYTSPSFYRF